jgi:hypothetical protein
MNHRSETLVVGRHRKSKFRKLAECSGIYIAELYRRIDSLSRHLLGSESATPGTAEKRSDQTMDYRKLNREATAGEETKINE